MKKHSSINLFYDQENEIEENFGNLFNFKTNNYEEIDFIEIFKRESAAIYKSKYLQN